MSVLELKIPPVALVVAVAVAMGCVSAGVPSLAVSLPWRNALAVAFVGAGFIISLAAVVAFRKAKTTVNPTTPGAASAMVTSGIYRLSRNPMYLGLLLALTGWATFLSHALAFVFLPVFVAYMNRFQITPEERALSANFGSEFVTYKQATRRWL